MKITIDIDCTPQEARAFLGLPHIEPMQDALVAQMQERLSGYLAGARPRGADEALAARRDAGAGRHPGALLAPADGRHAGGGGPPPKSKKPKERRAQTVGSRWSLKRSRRRPCGSCRSRYAAARRRTPRRPAATDGPAARSGTRSGRPCRARRRAAAPRPAAGARPISDAAARSPRPRPRSGWPTAAFSSAIELIHSPPELIMSLARSVISMKPCSVDRRDVAGREPAVGVEGLGAGGGVLEIGRGDPRAAHEEHAGRARRRGAERGRHRRRS